MRADTDWTWATFGFALTVPIILWVGRYDQRLLSGVNVWSKPFKFALSLAIHFEVDPGFRTTGRGVTGPASVAATERDR